MTDEESLVLGPCRSGFSSSSILEMALGFTSLRVFSSFSELGSEEEEEEEEEEGEEESKAPGRTLEDEMKDEGDVAEESHKQAVRKRRVRKD